MSEVTSEDLRDLRDTMADRLERGFTALNERLDILNGRTRTNENNIAVLNERTSNFASELKALNLEVIAIERPSKGTAAAWGGGVAGAIWGVMQFVKYLTGK